MLFMFVYSSDRSYYLLPGAVVATVFCLPIGILAILEVLKHRKAIREQNASKAEHHGELAYFYTQLGLGITAGISGAIAVFSWLQLPYPTSEAYTPRTAPPLRTIPILPALKGMLNDARDPDMIIRYTYLVFKPIPCGTVQRIKYTY